MEEDIKGKKPIKISDYEKEKKYTEDNKGKEFEINKYKKNKKTLIYMTIIFVIILLIALILKVNRTKDIEFIKDSVVMIKI